MTPTRLPRRPALAAALFAALFTFASAGPAADGTSFEKTIPIPKNRDVKLDWTAGGCAVRSLSLRNYPSEEDVQKARDKDHDDKSWLWWNFEVENRSSTKCRISLIVDVYAPSGKVVKSSDKSDTVEEHKMDDNIRLSMRMRTLDIEDAPNARIRAQIGPK
jgi:hypothetical protein